MSWIDRRPHSQRFLECRGSLHDTDQVALVSPPSVAVPLVFFWSSIFGPRPDRQGAVLFIRRQQVLKEQTVEVFWSLFWSLLYGFCKWRKEYGYRHTTWHCSQTWACTIPYPRQLKIFERSVPRARAFSCMSVLAASGVQLRIQWLAWHTKGGWRLRRTHLMSKTTKWRIGRWVKVEDSVGSVFGVCDLDHATCNHSVFAPCNMEMILLNCSWVSVPRTHIVA